jgi:hypothetical protein
MKLKTLKKKIRRLEKRLREGPMKLAKLKRNLAELEAKKEAAARVRLAERSAAKPAPAQDARPAGGAATTKDRKAAAAVKTSRAPNFSPERRAKLSAAMKARWAARKAAAETTSQPATPRYALAPQENPVPE